MKRFLMILGCIGFLAAGCASVLKQDIPVSTNPMGAKIYANGQLVGNSPMTVSLERNRDHILTLVKDNYLQEDVIIKRVYQKEKTYLNAISTGVNTGLFFKDARMGIGSSMMSMSGQESSGEAYILVPRAVAVDLSPTAGTAPSRAPESARKDNSGGMATSTEDPPLDKAEMAKGLMKVGTEAGFEATKPLKKEKEISSSSKTYVRPDGAVVTEKKSTKVGGSINPAGAVNSILDILFK